MLFIRVLAVFCFGVIFSLLPALGGTSLGMQTDLVSDTMEPDAFPLVRDGQASPLWLDQSDWPGVLRAANDLQADIERVTGVKAAISQNGIPAGKTAVLVGTLGRSAVIDQLAKNGKIDAGSIVGKWESFLIAVVDQPVPGLEKALVIAGSDKRGTIYGIYEISEQIGVSPWYWWADVPVKEKKSIFIKKGSHTEGPPVVQYRGIFLNDEQPALSGWGKEKFGGFNQQFYAKVFELILRLRGNYLWPAMWGNAFNEDDRGNPRLADEYGIVMGTSHHEPMMRAQREWGKRKSGPEGGNGEWNYSTNEAALKKFWENGIERNKRFENIVTIGMRGDGDEPMIEGGDMASNVKLLEKIVSDQREMLAKDVNADVTKVPQIWALYKEVMDYYEHGMRVPDDITLLWCDDNWGNVRRLPTPEERKRVGGAGLYYHFDYVGGPRNYKWINTNPLPKIWEQMNLAWQYGATKLWIVNVGDLKPMEVPTEFFLRMAWNPAAWPKEKISEYTRLWAEREFGSEHAAEIADLVSKYAKYNGWRKPELLSPETFSQTNFREAERVSEMWGDVVSRAENLYNTIPENQRDAFYQLVLYPAKASATVSDLYIAAGRNRLFAAQGRASANQEATRVKELFAKDQELSDYYNKKLAGGKWNHLMDQTRIGYTSWQQPKTNVMPEVKEIAVPETDEFGVAIEGSNGSWPNENKEAELFPFDSLNERQGYIDVFAKGSKPIQFNFKASHPWIVVRKDKTPGGLDDRLWVEIDWKKAPAGSSKGTITIEGAGKTVVVGVPALKASLQQEAEAKDAFGSLVGPIAIAAEAVSENVPKNGVQWHRIEDYGRGISGMTISPTTAESVASYQDAPRLEYPIYVPKEGNYKVDVIAGPTLNFVPGRGLRIAVGLDDQEAQILDLYSKSDSQKTWETSVADNIRVFQGSLKVDKPGRHTLKVYMVDPGVVLQKLIVREGALPKSYFGPPEMSLKAKTR